MLQLIHGSWTLHDTSEQSLQLFLDEHVQKFSNHKNCVLILWKMSAPNQGFENFSVGSHLAFLKDKSDMYRKQFLEMQSRVQNYC